MSLDAGASELRGVAGASGRLHRRGPGRHGRDGRSEDASGARRAGSARARCGPPGWGIAPALTPRAPSTYLLKRYEHTFLGSDAVAWMLDRNIVQSTRDALAMGNGAARCREALARSPHRNTVTNPPRRYLADRVRRDAARSHAGARLLPPRHPGSRFQERAPLLPLRTGRAIAWRNSYCWRERAGIVVGRPHGAERRGGGRRRFVACLTSARAPTRR